MNRQAFEAFISAPPFEMPIERFDDRCAWPGSYTELEVDLAWQAWQAATDAALAAKPEQDRAQLGEPVLWRYRDSEQVIRAMDGYTPVEGWTPLYTATQPAHTEAEVQEILDSSLREWGVFEQTVRIILNVEKP